MFTKLFRCCLFAICILNLTACGTIISLTENNYSVYAGVSKDFYAMQNSGILGVLAVIDLPLSFVLDTLMLPITLSK